MTVRLDIPITMSFPTKLSVLIIFIVGLLLAPYFIWHETLDGHNRLTGYLGV